MRHAQVSTHVYIFINDLMDVLHQEANGITYGMFQVYTLMYVNILILIADNPYTMDNLVHSLNQWYIDNSMNIN